MKHTSYGTHHKSQVTHESAVVHLNIVFFFPDLGQHLITALAESMFGYKTTSWYCTFTLVTALWTE